MNTHKDMYAHDKDGIIIASSENIVSYIDQAEHIKDPSKLQGLEFEGFRIVKDVCNSTPWNHNIEVIDLKLDVFGPREDDYYAASTSLVKNIRRGNSIIKVHDGKGGKKFFMGRKGMMKFFDLRLDFISKQERHGLGIKPQKEDMHQMKNYILAPALKAIKDGNEVEVLKTLKANGENVQVSYLYDIESWVVCSKNVAILVRSREDILPYTKCEMASRYSFACEMAHVWFDKIQSMD